MQKFLLISGYFYHPKLGDLYLQVFLFLNLDSNRLKSIKNLFLIKDKLDWIINDRAIKYGNGIHPKHQSLIISIFY